MCVCRICGSETSTELEGRLEVVVSEISTSVSWDGFIPWENMVADGYH